MVKPRMWAAPGGYPADHDYVRRYWTAAIGAGAVADLLRLMQAAKRRRSIRRPVNTPALVRSGLVRRSRGHTCGCGPRCRPLPSELLPRLTPALRQELPGWTLTPVTAPTGRHPEGSPPRRRRCRDR